MHRTFYEYLMTLGKPSMTIVKLRNLVKTPFGSKSRARKGLPPTKGLSGNTTGNICYHGRFDETYRAYRGEEKHRRKRFCINKRGSPVGRLTLGHRCTWWWCRMV